MTTAMRLVVAWMAGALALAIGFRVYFLRHAELENQALRRFLPDTRFFKTALAAPFMEYRHVETLVSFRWTATGDDIRSCVSPTYDSASGKFLSQFHGINVSTPEARRTLALAIAQLFAEVTFQGRALLSTTTVVDGRAELWHGALHWRDIDVLADSYGRADRIFMH